MTRYFCTQNGVALSISTGERLGGGGEGTIFSVCQMSGCVAKILLKPSVQLRQKLEVMLSNPCVAPPEAPMPVAWPERLLFANVERRDFVGYLMPKVTRAQPIIDFYHPKARRKKYPAVDYRHLLRAGVNATKVVQLAHSLGYVIGDINESNLLGAENACVTMVDADSWQVCDPETGTIFRCAVGKPDFTPAELQGQNLGAVNRAQCHDYFGLAVLLFKLQMEGVHPFDGVFKEPGEVPTIEARIAAGHFPYSKRSVPYVPKPLAPPFQILHPRVQELITRCFEDGHFDPDARPDAQAWHDAMQEAENSLVQCPRTPRHWYGRHLDQCPWCERANLMGGLDPFPYTEVSVRRNVRRKNYYPRHPAFDPLAALSLIFPRVHQLVPQSKASRTLGLPFPLLVIVALWMIMFMALSLLGALAHALTR